MYACGSYSRSAGLYSCEDGSLLALLPARHHGGITHLLFSPNGYHLYTGGRKVSGLICAVLLSLTGLYSQIQYDRYIHQSETLLFVCMFWTLQLMLCVTASRIQRSCAGTSEFRDKFCSPCTGTSIQTSVSTLTWTSKIKIYQFTKNDSIVIRSIYVLLMLIFVCLK